MSSWQRLAEEQRREMALRLRLAREQTGLSQGDVARQFGLAQSIVSDIEGARRRVDVAELIVLAALYDRPPCHFLPPHGHEEIPLTVL